jgi:fatty-acyl-CoA synthase
MMPNFNVQNKKVESLLQKASQFTVGDILRKNARTKPDHLAVALGERQLTFAQLNQEVNRLANSFSNLGIERGDRVAILSENRMEYCQVIYAAAKLGVIVPALNWRFSEGELKESILLTTPETILVSAEHLGKLRALFSGLPFVKRIILLDKDEDKSRLPQISTHRYEDLISTGSPEEVQKEVTMEDGLIILYTSGTTGVPKGAIISHRAMIARSLFFGITFGLAEEDGFVAWAPMFHMASTDQMIATHALGGKVIIMRRYDPCEMASLLEKERLGWLIMMPGAIEPLIAELRTRPIKIKGLKAVGAMADLVPPAQISELTSILGAPYVNTFGSTETGLPPATGSLIPMGSTTFSLSKKESSLCEIRLVDENDNEVPVGDPGELIIRGPTLFSGYWNNPETNKKDFKDGWFHTGDVFQRNPDGSLDFVDRRKYMIKSGGENIYPAEIERVLMSYPGVQEAVVIRIKDPQWGEVPKAYIASEKKIDQAKLADFCRRHLARYKIPKSIKCVSLDQFPRSTTGKILRSKVEKWA